MKTLRTWTLLALGIVMTAPFLGPATAQGQPGRLNEGRLKVALVTVIKPPVSWNPDCIHIPPAGWRALVKSRQPRQLHAGELVRCGRGGVAELLLTSGLVTMTSGQTLPIVNVPPAERAPLDSALGALLVTAGNLRGRTPVFLSPSGSDSPSARSAVCPETFTFEWRPYPRRTTLTLALRGAPGGPTLWQETGIPGETGRCLSPGAREALVRRQAASETKDLILEVQPSEGVPFQIAFSVISASRERSLQKALTLWTTVPNGLLRHLGRASVFYRDALYPESAAEYDAALKMEPASPLLRRRAVEAYQMYQNRTRANALETPQK